MEHQFCPYCMSPIEEGKPCEACGLTEGSYTPSPHHLPPGTVLRNRYLVGRVLGEGGFGITYIGCDLQLELKAAIKEYFPTDKASRVSQASLDVSSYAGVAGVNYEKGLKWFLQEARTIARMDKQPVIVNVRDFFESNHTAYIVMEYVEGTTFKELVVQRGGRIPAGELLYRIEPLFFALKEMHGNGLIHRDISPENLMLEKGEVRLLDFGCAREAADGDNTLTVALKHGYAPVEQYQSKGQGPWTDVYALSATIYYCLTGRKPPQAVDRLGEDSLVPPRRLGVELTQSQERALLHAMAVPPKRRFQSMEEFHTALYEGSVQGKVEEPVPEPEVRVPEAAAPVRKTEASVPLPESADEPEDMPKAGFSLAAWLKRNRLLAAGLAAALVLVVLVTAVLPRAMAPARPEEDPPETDAPVQTPETDGTEADAQAGLRQAEALMTWLRQNDAEADPAEIRAKVDALPIDQIFADAVHVTTLEALDEALRGSRPIVIDGDIDLSGAGDARNSCVPILIVEGVTLSGSWEGGGVYRGSVEGSGFLTVDGSLLINRGTLRDRVVLGDWDGQGDANLLVNYGTVYGDVGMGSEETCDAVVVNLGRMGIPRTQFLRTSFYNLGTLLHGTAAPEGETAVTIGAENEDYFIDLIRCFLYNGGEIVVEGQDQSRPGRIDVDVDARFVNRGSVRLGPWGQLNNRSTLINHGQIAASDPTAQINNLGWLLNAGSGCALDTDRCYNVGLIQAGPETPVDLKGIHSEDGGAVIPFGWYEGMEDDPSLRHASDPEAFRQALADPDCAWIVLNNGTALTLTEDLVLTKGLAIAYDASLILDGAALTLAGEAGYLVCDGTLDLRGGVFTVRDEAAALVNGLTDCGGVTLRRQGYLLTRTPLSLNEGAAVELTDARYLCCVGTLEIRGGQLRLERSLLRTLDHSNLSGCTVEIGENSECLADGGVYWAPDTAVTNRGHLTCSGPDGQEFACRLTNAGFIELTHEIVISGSLVNEGTLSVWCCNAMYPRVSGSLENRGTVEFPNGGKIQPWAAGTVIGVPEDRIAN